MAKTFRIIKLLTLLAALLLLLAIPIWGLVSTATGYRGQCHGFDQAWAACPWWKFAGIEMVWASFLFIPFLFMAAVVWLGMALAEFIRLQFDRRRERRNRHP